MSSDIEDLGDGRPETPAQRADRNGTDVLQELRVLQTGTQTLTGFLLALAFQPAFADLGRRGRSDRRDPRTLGGGADGAPPSRAKG
nr:DUF6328 family protein [Microbacterium testaceum]